MSADIAVDAARRDLADRVMAHRADGIATGEMDTEAPLDSLRAELGRAPTTIEQDAYVGHFDALCERLGEICRPFADTFRKYDDEDESEQYEQLMDELDDRCQAVIMGIAS